MKPGARRAGVKEGDDMTPAEEPYGDTWAGRGQELQDQEDLDAGLLPTEAELRAMPTSPARDAQNRRVDLWWAATMQQFVASINAKAMQNDLPKPEK